MPKTCGLLRCVGLFLFLFLLLCLLLYPSARVGKCPGQFVLYSTLNHDESQLLVVTLPSSPFG